MRRLDHPRISARRGPWLAALTAAACLHAACALWSLGSRAERLPAPLLASEALSVFSVEVTPVHAARDDSAEPGGGSLAPGQAQLAQQFAALPSIARLGHGRDLRAAQPPRAPDPGAARVPAPNADSRALFEMNEPDLASEFALLGAPALAVRALPARLERLSESAGAPAPGAGRNILGHYLGTRGGTGAGPGGTGSGLGNQHLFGGKSGAFRADVCFLEPGKESLREFPPCRAALTLHTSSINVPAQSFTRGFPGIPQRSEWFSIRFTGEFHVQASGVYQFRVVSDDGSMVFIDRQLLIDNDGHHGPRSRAGALELEPGKHAFELDYYQGPREMIALQFFVTPPGGGEQLFGPSL